MCFEGGAYSWSLHICRGNCKCVFRKYVDTCNYVTIPLTSRSSRDVKHFTTGLASRLDWLLRSRPSFRKRLTLMKHFSYRFMQCVCILWWQPFINRFNRRTTVVQASVCRHLTRVCCLPLEWFRFRWSHRLIHVAARGFSAISRIFDNFISSLNIDFNFMGCLFCRTEICGFFFFFWWRFAGNTLLSLSLPRSSRCRMPLGWSV